MNYAVVIHRAAQKELEKIAVEARSRIYVALAALDDNPRPPGCKKLTGSQYWRIRVGVYRVIYLISDEARRVEVTWIGHRSAAYR